MGLWMWPVFVSGFRRQMIYRRAMAMGAIASLGFAAIRLLILHSLYLHREVVAGLTFEQVATWALLAGMLFTFVYPPWSHDFPQSIRTGEVLTDLLKPVNTFALQLLQQMGRLVAMAVVRVLPVLIVATLVLPIPAPKGATGWACLIVSLIFLTVSSAAFIYLIGTTAFFTSDHHLWMAFAYYALQLLAGVYVPVEFVPGALGTFMRYGPGMAFLPSPTRIINDIHPLQTLMIQGFWTLIFFSLAYAALQLGRKHLVIFGG